MDENIEDLNRQIELENAQMRRELAPDVKASKVENLVETPHRQAAQEPQASTVVNEFSGQAPGKR